MEVINNTYQELLLDLLNETNNYTIDNNNSELIINLYLTLLSLSNLEFNEEINQKEKTEIEDFLRKLNNIKVKIQLKRKQDEINKLSQELINQYYENINILSIYIPDGIALEKVINSMDAKEITKLIDSVTKDKMNKNYNQETRDKRRDELMKLLPYAKYYIENDIIYIQNDDTYEEICIKDFIEMFSYLLNPDNYKKIYSNQQSQNNHDLIIANIIKLLIVQDKKKEEIDKVLYPMILTYILPIDLNNIESLDTSHFKVENIKITELYSFASKEHSEVNSKTSKWRNISIPNEYLINKLKDMIAKGMYYYHNNSLVFEHIDNRVSDFKVSIEIENIKQLLITILEQNLKKEKTTYKHS